MKRKLKYLLVLVVAFILALPSLSAPVLANNGDENSEEAIEIDETVNNESPQIEADKTYAVSIQELNQSVEVGQSANYQLYFGLSGRGAVYNNLVLHVELPEQIDGVNVMFNQNLQELAINGVVPTYDAITKSLTYAFGTIEGGFESNAIIKVDTRNGAALDKVVLTTNVKVIEDGVLGESAYASLELASNKNASLSNKFLGLLINDELQDAISYRINQIGVYGIGISVNRYQSGSMELDENSNVVFSYNIPNGMTYVGDNSGVTPSIDPVTNTYTWEFPVLANSDEIYYFQKNFEIQLYVGEELDYFSSLVTKGKADFHFIDESYGSIEANSSVMIVPEDKTELEEYKDGFAYSTIFSGPADNVGTPGWINNDDITVEDSALLAWRLYLTSLGATSPTYGFNSYDVFFNPDKNLNITQFYSGDFYLRSSSTYANGTLLEREDKVKMSMSVLYEDTTEWEHLVEELESSTMYKASDLGIDSNRKVSSVWLHVHNGTDDIFNERIGISSESWMNLPIGITSLNTTFYTKIDKGYLGKLESTSGIAYSGWTGKGFLQTGISKYVPEEARPLDKYTQLIDAFESRLAPKTANVAKAPEGISRYVKANAYLSESENNIVPSGDNTLVLDIINDAASINPLSGPFVSYAIIDNDIELQGISLSTGGSVEIVDTNYNNQDRTLIKITSTADFISMNRVSRIRIPVSIREDAKYKISIDFLGYLNEDFEVAQTANKDGSITRKEIDSNDVNGNNNLEENIYVTNNVYSYRSAYEFIGLSLVGNETMSKTASVSPNSNTVDLENTIMNVKNSAISELTIVNVLPAIDDNYSSIDNKRNSKFDVNLTSPITLPVMYEDSFDVYYSESRTPLLEENEQGEIEENSEFKTSSVVWLKENEVVDFSKIRSFKIVMRENARTIRDSELTFTAHLTVPENELTGEEDLENRIAYNTFAFTINDGQTIESLNSSIVFTKDQEPDPIPENPDPEKPDPELPNTENPIPEEPSVIDPTPQLPEQEQEAKNETQKEQPVTGVNINLVSSVIALLGSLSLLVLMITKKNKRKI